MNKFKQCTYTVLLILTCFLASPLIVHKIWTTSTAAKKPPAAVAPPVVEKKENTADSETAQQPAGQPADNAQSTTAAAPADGISPAETTPAQPDIFVKSELSYFDNALFIGDSRTVGIKEYGDFKNSDFFCDQGLSAYKINDAKINGVTFDSAIDAKQYGKVYVMLGINEVGMDHEYVLTAYRAIIEKIKVHQPDAIIYIQGNLHVSSFAEDGVINNAGIDDLNKGMASLADNKRVFYIDINELYDDEYGYFNSGYTTDGVHPLAMYYTQWCEWLCTKTVPVGGTNVPAETTQSASASSTEATTYVSEQATETTTAE